MSLAMCAIVIACVGCDKKMRRCCGCQKVASVESHLKKFTSALGRVVGTAGLKSFYLLYYFEIGLWADLIGISINMKCCKWVLIIYDHVLFNHCS